MRVLLVGAGGYGAMYVRELLKGYREDVVFEGIVDPYVSCSLEYANIIEASIPVYDTMDDFYSEHEADLVVICTPPFLHREQSVNALSHGSYVLCEKPVAPTLKEAQAMLEAEKRYGRFIAVGYQWSYSDAITALKRDILEGKLGAPIFLKTMISWPRNFAYYRRGGGWGGRIEKDGLIVLDSIASNACAHYLHNMLFLLGESMDTSACAESVEGDCFRANAIETFDTCTLRARVKNAIIYFAASHATGVNRNPVFHYRFEKATVLYSEEDGGRIRAVFDDGRVVDYGNPSENNFKKLWITVECIERAVRPNCTVETAMAHTKVIEEIHQKLSYRTFRDAEVHLTESGDGVYVPALIDKLLFAYENGKVLSEL